MKPHHLLLAFFILLAGCSETGDTSGSSDNSSSPTTNASQEPDAYSQLRANVGAWLSGQLTIQEALPRWFVNIEPTRVIGPIHMVGAMGLSSFFIPTSDGHILIDAPLPQHGPVILDHIRALGYDPADLKILLNTHAHWDHFGGLAQIKAETGATMIASAADRPLLEAGFDRSDIDPFFKVPGVVVDQVVRDGEVVELGGVQLKAEILPGHSPGCTSWSLKVEDAGQTYEALVFCSITVSPLGLPKDPKILEELVANYRDSFEKAKAWRPDVFLSNHEEFYNPDSKLQRLRSGDTLAFVDREEFPIFLSRMENEFNMFVNTQLDSMGTTESR